MASHSEENYLKNIFLLCKKDPSIPVSTSALSEALATKAASVTDMLKRLSAKKLLHYKKYQGVLLTLRGRVKAIAIIRRHRLWEYFLTEKLKFQWDEVHEVADQLEHVNSELLIDKLDSFLGYPKFDPHGDPIPDHAGKIATADFQNLASLPLNKMGKIVAVLEQQPAFLKHLHKLNIRIGSRLKVIEKIEFDKSLSIAISNGSRVTLSHEIAKNILISK